MSEFRAFRVALLLIFVARAGSVLRVALGNYADVSVRMKVYYINVDRSVERAQCLKDQLIRLKASGAKRGWHIEAERFPAIAFKPTCVDLQTCMAERPECFPAKQAFSTHGHKVGEDMIGMTRAVWSNACSHLKILQKMEAERWVYDYFLMLEDDVVLAKGTLDSLRAFITNFDNHWSLLTIDTWSSPPTPPLFGDHFPKETTKGLPLLSVSPTESTFWGAHAWFFNSDHVSQFTNYYSSMPLMPADWITKFPAPLHLGMWAFNPGNIRQKRFFTDQLLRKQHLAPVCSQQSESDIVPGTENITVPIAFRRIAKHPRLRTKPSEVVILGMKGARTDELKKLIHEALEEPNDVALCTGDVANKCGELSFGFDPQRWQELSDFKDKVALVAVRHPFAVAEHLETQSDHLHCHGCEARCQSGSRWAKHACLWTAKMESYAALKEKGLFKKMIFIRYEDVMETPDAIAHRLANIVGVPRIKNELTRSSATGISFYYGAESCGALADMCSSLDLGLLWTYGYHGCQQISTTYTERVFEAIGDQPKFFNDCANFDQWKK